MLPSLNYDSKDPKYTLLAEIFNIIDSKKARNILSRNGVNNRQMMAYSIKILFMAMYFDYNVSNIIKELNRTSKLRKFAGFNGEIPTAEQVYEYFSRYSAEQYCNIINSMFNMLNKPNRGKYNQFIADATPSACDFNNDKHFIPKEHLEKLNLKWSYSTTKGSFIGFKLTVVINKATLSPVSVLIHSGAPNDAKIFDEVLKELCRRRIIKDKDIILFDRGYFAYKNYQIGINKYKIIPVIFPKSIFSIDKLKGQMSYPMEVYFNNKRSKELKEKINSMSTILFEKLKNWKDLKPIRGLIEDFFKVAKDAFGLGEFQSYTIESMSRKIYLCLLLTALIINQGFDTKTKLQKLAEGNIILEDSKTNNKYNNTSSNKNKKDESTPQETVQQTLEVRLNKRQKTLEKWI